MPSLRAAIRNLLGRWHKEVVSSWQTFLHGAEPAISDVRGALRLEGGEVVFPAPNVRESSGASRGSCVFRALDGLSTGSVRPGVRGQNPCPSVLQATGRASGVGDVRCRPRPVVAR